MEPQDVRLHIDECAHVALASALREQGFDARNARDEGMLGCSDEEVWAHFIHVDRILFTHNVVDFGPMHDAWVSAGKEHPGLIFSPQADVGILIRNVGTLLRSLDVDAIRSNILWP